MGSQWIFRSRPSCSGRCRWSSRSRLHEAAHGYVARMFGDQTAWMLGRVTRESDQAHRSRGDDSGPGDAGGDRGDHAHAGVHFRVGEARSGEFRQPAQSEARHVLGGRRRTVREFPDGARVGVSAQGRRCRAALVASDGLLRNGRRRDSDQSDADGFEPVADSSARRRPHRGQPAAAFARDRATRGSSPTDSWSSSCCSRPASWAT